MSSIKYDWAGNSLIKDYIVTNKAIPGCIFIVSATGAHDAINQVYNNYMECTYKEDYDARSIGSLHSEHGKIIKL